MVNKKVIRRRKSPSNIFEWGGPVGNITSLVDTPDLSQIKELGKGGISGSIGMQPIVRPKGFDIGGIGAIGSSVGTIVNTGVDNARLGDTFNIEEGIKDQGSTIVGASSNTDLISEWNSLNRIKDDYSWKDIRGGSNGQRGINTLSSTASGITTGASIGGPIGAVVGGAVGLGSALTGWLTGNRKAKKKARKLNQQAKEANERALNAFEVRAENIDTQNDFNMLANYSAYGGPLDFGGGAIGYEFDNRYLNNQEMSAIAKQKLTSLPNSFQALPEMNTYNAFAEGGGIHIKEKNKGKFTKYCGGKVTEACIRKGKNSSNPTTRKRATFADNARNWNAFGGWLNTQGGDFTNGVTFIDEGGSHEENPYQGVQIGVDPEGAPNLVEQGEVVYDDYVFSDRMEIPDDIRKEYKLRGKTFAKAAKSAQRESEERPNDPLSKRGLQASMSRIAQAQEEVKEKKGAYREGNEYPSMFAFGGDKRQTFTRYAPIIGSGIASLTDIFSEPEYEGADMISGVDLGAETVGYNPIGNYLSYKPLDRDFYINKMNQQAAATRRGLINTSGGNRATAQAGILAADYNYGQNMGNLARQAEEYNQQLRERVEAFNRGTNMFNTETGLKASMFNAESRNAAKRARLGQATTTAQLRQGIKDQDSARRSANITNFLQGLGDMGWENFNANMINSNPALYYDLDSSGRVGYKRNKKRKGGRIVK
nr:MAG TPA: bacteriocin [Crassvirales sp.]